MKIVIENADTNDFNELAKLARQGKIHTFYMTDEEERPQGEWLEICDIKSWQFTNEHYECDKCHYKGNKSNFCPNCGADMRGDVE